MTEVDPVLLPIQLDDPRPAPEGDAALDLLILSKDRACQLDALLRSIRAFLNVPHRIHILYTSSNVAFERVTIGCALGTPVTIGPTTPEPSGKATWSCLRRLHPDRAGT